jgi:DNA-binding beta-propeller fold protein YncE
VDSQGNIVCAGITTQEGPPPEYDSIHRIFVHKYTPEGNLVWSSVYSGSPYIADLARSMEIDFWDNIYVVGTSMLESDSNTAYLTVKFNSQGALQWARTLDGPEGSYDEAWEVDIDADGEVCVSETSGSYLTPTKIDILTICYDSRGVPLWQHTYDGNNNNEDYPSNVRSDPEGNLYVAGNSRINFDSHDIVLMKFSGAIDPVTTLSSIIISIDNLVDEGVLAAGLGNSLSAPLESALKQIDRGNIRAAVNKLNAFINHVKALIRAEKLDETVGNSLIQFTLEIIEALGSWD